MNLEVSAYTKGSLNLRFYGDFYSLIPNSRLFIDAGYFTDKRFEFYGFNGFASPYFKDIYVMNDATDNGRNTLREEFDPEFNSVFYRMDRKQFRFNSCLRTKFGFGEHLYYGVGLSYFNYNMGRINIHNEEYFYDQQMTLFELYKESGLIRADEADGGNVTQIKLAFIYDSKNHDSDPTKGAYFEATITGAPDLIDRDGYSHMTFNAVWQHYIPIVKENLTFAYRLVTQNVIGEIPYYAAFNSNMLFYKKMSTDALGGANSVRGINRNRVIGAGYAWLNAELRWKVVGFQFINQNWNVALNPFFDAGMVTQSYRLAEQETAWSEIEKQYNIIGNNDLIYSEAKEGIHTSAGCGLKLIMNRNFIISAEAAKALNARDGEGMRVYIGFNYLF
jgi:outer membrane protein assembly factor BamA